MRFRVQGVQGSLRLGELSHARAACAPVLEAGVHFLGGRSAL